MLVDNELPATNHIHRGRKLHWQVLVPSWLLIATESLVQVTYFSN